MEDGGCLGSIGPGQHQPAHTAAHPLLARYRRLEGLLGFSLYKRRAVLDRPLGTLDRRLRESESLAMRAWSWAPLMGSILTRPRFAALMKSGSFMVVMKARRSAATRAFGTPGGKTYMRDVF